MSQEWQGHDGANGATVSGDGREETTAFVRTRELAPTTVAAVRKLVASVGHDMAIYKQLKSVPPGQTRNFRNDMYIISEALRLMDEASQPTIGPDDATVLKSYRTHIDKATKFIPIRFDRAVGRAVLAVHEALRLSEVRAERRRLRLVVPSSSAHTAADALMAA